MGDNCDFLVIFSINISYWKLGWFFGCIRTFGMHISWLAYQVGNKFASKTGMLIGRHTAKKWTASLGGFAPRLQFIFPLAFITVYIYFKAERFKRRHYTETILLCRLSVYTAPIYNAILSPLHMMGGGSKVSIFKDSKNFEFQIVFSIYFHRIIFISESFYHRGNIRNMNERLSPVSHKFN